MRAWQRWSWPLGEVQRAYLSPGLNPCLKHALLLTCGKHDSPGSTTTLRGELRRLYKLIHPDLLHNQPVQQATNQKSFQLLQEYLSAAKGADGSNRFAYHFEFYIRGKANDDSLKKIEVSLPAPQTRGQSPQERDILPATRKAIGKLFAACGLSINLSDFDEKPNLPTLFQEASELQRQSEASLLNLQQQVSLISNALHIGRGIRVLFRAPVEVAHLDVQVQLLERLAKAMDGSLGINLSGNTFIIGNCYKVDFLGRLWLNYEESVELWTQFIHQADLFTASARRIAAKSRQAKEETVARLMGVEFVFADDALALHPDYSFFLGRVGDGAAEHGAVGGGRFSELPVRVSQVEFPMVDEVLGCVTLPVREEFTNLYKFIETSGDMVLKLRRKMKLRESMLEDLRKHVRLKLRLRHLTFDRKLSTDKLTSACTRLSRHAARLTIYTEGLSLCISDEYRLPDAGSGYFVHMKWNFSLDHL